MTKSISEITQLWDRILEKVESKINDRHIFDSFFSGSYIHSIDADTMLVVVNSGLAASLLATKYNDLVSNIVKEASQTEFKIRFVQKQDVQKTIKEPVVEKSNFFANSYINSKFTFDNLVVGASNREASQAALMIAANPGKMFNPLFIYSQSGLGKTHLLHAMGNYIKEHNPVAKVLYISTDDFVEEFIKYVHGDKESETLKDFFKTVDVLLVDDVQFLADKVKTEEMFFHIFNTLVNANKQIVLTSDRHPSELKGLEDRLVSRFSSGLTVNISAPDPVTCVTILKKKITANGLDIQNFDEDVLQFFAERFSNNIRELEGALNRLMFYIINIRQTKHIDMAVALESVQSLINVQDVQSKLSEQKIINTVADYYNLTPTQITGRIRNSQIALARHISMYLIRTMLDTPFQKIGQTFGGKDHSTVISAITKVEKMLKTDSLLSQAINDLQKRLKN